MLRNVEVSDKEVPILKIIQDIKDGRIEAGSLSKDIRQQCVEVFLAEGYSVPQMAQILKKCDKTIRRDVAEIRERNALSPDIELAKKIIGELVSYARIHRGHLMRMARSQNASISEKAQSEYFAFKVSTELVGKLQTLGYLPLKPQEIVADFSHCMSADDEKSLEELKAQIIEIEKISRESGELTPEVIRELEDLRKRIDKAEIQNKVIEISTKNTKGESHEQSNK